MLVLLVVGMVHHENDITVDTHTHTQEKRGNSKSDEDEGGEERKSSWIWLKEWQREETDVRVRV